MQVFTHTHQGPRIANEDGLLADIERGLFVICDGVGGHPNGDLAAEATIDMFCNLETLTGATLIDAIRDANHHCKACSDARSTTCTAVLIQDNKAIVRHAGDTRAWLMHKQSLRQLTTDHGYKAYLSNAVGFLTDIQCAQYTVEPGDTIILTTDGIHDYISVETISQIVAISDIPAKDLVAEALLYTKDNCTAIIIRL